MIWFGDNSELNGIWDAAVPDILIFGGIAIHKTNIPPLIDLITSVKQRYRTEADFPLKYNLRDLKSWYQQRQMDDLYLALQNESKFWRRNLIEGSLSCEYTIVVACINFHSAKADQIKKNKEKVAQYCFSNALMRVALLTKETTATTCDIVLDWPDKGRHQPFTEEYRSAYYLGHCFGTPEITYFSGPLKNIGFIDTPSFVRMEESNLLQFTDIVVGSIRDFVDYSLDQKDENQLGVQLTKILIPKFRGFPSRIIGRGISVAPPGGDLGSRLLRSLHTLREHS